MIGDPGGRSEERNLLDDDTLEHNVAAIKPQISRSSTSRATGRLVDNATGPADLAARLPARVGKHVTVNQMMAKES